MDALSGMEKNLNNKIKTAVQSVKVYLRFTLHYDPGTCS